ncbi:hypothetical protein BGZ75_010079 [Mortierella antarctica]|nr:hypothetical protein BGZ75_010079 [Mortierella antarctica]
MRVLWFKFTSVVVIAVTLALSHMNSAVATNVDNNIDYVQQHHHHYVERGLENPQDQQDDGTVATTAKGPQHPKMHAVDKIPPNLCAPLVDKLASTLDIAINTSLALILPVAVPGSPLIGGLEGLAKGIAKQANDTGAMAALTVTAVNITVAIIKEYQDFLATVDHFPSVVFETVYGLFQAVTAMASAVQSCTGATTNCKFVSPIFGYIILASLPAIKKDMPVEMEELLNIFAGAAQGLINNAEGALQTIVDQVNQLAPLKDSLNFQYQVAFDVVGLFAQASC